MSDQFTWTDDRIDKLHNLRANTDDTWDQIGERFGVTGNAARKAYKRHLEDRVDNIQRQERRADNMREVFDDIEWPEDPDWREFVDIYEEINNLHERFDPIDETVTVDFSDVDEPIAVVSASDLHMGGGFTSHRAIKETMEYILEHDQLKVGITGDAIEGFIPGVKPAETTEQQAGSVKSQIQALESLVNELHENDSLLWMSSGEHDGRWFEQEVGFNPIKKLVEDKIPYFTGRGLIKLKVGSQEYFVMANHNERFSSQWSDTHGARRAYEQFFPADVVITCHTHQPEWRVFWHYQELRAAGLGVGGKSILVQNGTYKTGPDGYTIRSWNRGIIGVPTVVFMNDEDDKEVFEGPRKAMRYINGA